MRVADARGQDRFVDLLRRQTTDRALEHRLKLVEVTLPVVFRHCGEGFGGVPVSAFAQFLGYAGEHMPSDIGDVFAPLAQRFDSEAELAQHLDQPVSYSIFRLAVCRVPLRSEDQPLAAVAPAPPLFLQVYGETLLQNLRQTGQFVDVDRPLLDGLDHSLRAEEDVVQSLSAESMGVDGEERLRPLRAGLMQDAGDLLLPQPAFPD